MDIRHRAGKANCCADALSRNPVDIAAVEAVTRDYMVMRDPDFTGMIDYLKSGTLPSDDQAARKLSALFDIIGGILHHENPNFPGGWCVAIPKSRRDDLIQEAHDGRFAGHLRRSVYMNSSGRDIGGHRCKQM